MARALVLAVFVLGACGGSRPGVASAAPPRPLTAIERILALLPDGPQVVVELDLARLRGNAVVGPVATTALAQLGTEGHLPGLPMTVAGSPLGAADAVVLAAYGVGTANATTITLLATKADVPNARRVGDFVVLGPEDWVGQVESRKAIADAHRTELAAPAWLLALREHAMPKGANGAMVRVTARLPFDARVALARMLGVDSAPAQLSLWGDIEDDLAIIVDADAADPGDKAGKTAARRLATTIQHTLGAIADLPAVRALGVPGSVTDARLIEQGTWVRTIIAVGPRHLKRVVERAREMLGPSS
jgi:hypothetical protein